MALILNLDTATEQASVCLSKNGECIIEKRNSHQKEHASFIHVAIQQVLENTGISIHDLDAVACTIGPGSYTGLRVGLSTAKGLCFALKKPLIGVNTLKLMAACGANRSARTGIIQPDMLLCPMIDARRMEVFVGLFTTALEEKLSPCAMGLTESSLAEWQNHPIICFGNGSEKFKSIAAKNIQFIEAEHSACDLGELAEERFKTKEFINIAYSTPVYLKEFYTPGS